MDAAQAISPTPMVEIVECHGDGDVDLHSTTNASRVFGMASFIGSRMNDKTDHEIRWRHLEIKQNPTIDRSSRRIGQENEQGGKGRQTKSLNGRKSSLSS